MKLKNIFSRKNAGLLKLLASLAGKGKVADAVQKAEDVVDVVKGRKAP